MHSAILCCGEAGGITGSVEQINGPNMRPLRVVEQDQEGNPSDLDLEL